MLTDLTRRAFLKTAGAVIVAFGLPVELRAETPVPRARPATDLANDHLDAWLAVAGDGRVTLFSGKVELGTGVETALS
jgi:nicotinate dehydrogenase subunit B